MNTLADVSARVILHVLESSWQAGVLAAVVVVLGWLLGERLSARWRCALWLVVVGRLLLPVAPESRVSLFNLLPSSPLAAPATTMSQPPMPVQPIAPANWDDAMAGAGGEPLPMGHDAGDTSAAAVEPVANALRWSVWQVAILVWLAGAAVVGARLLLMLARLRRVLSRCQPVVDENILAVFNSARRELGVRRRVDLLTTDANVGPAVAGVFRSRLIVSRSLLESLSPGELRLVLLHELSHVRRHDLAVQRLWVVAEMLHWFNPLVWLAARRWQTDRELACDEAVLARLDAPNRPGYGQAILRVMELLSSFRPVPGAVGVVMGRGFLTRRIGMIVRYRNRSRLWTLLAAVLLLALIPAGLTSAIQKDSDPRPSGSSADAKSRPSIDTPFVEVREPSGDIRIVLGPKGASKPDAARLHDAITRRLRIAGIDLNTPRVTDLGQVEIVVPRGQSRLIAKTKQLLSPSGALEFRILANRAILAHKTLIERAEKDKGNRILDDAGMWTARWVAVTPGREREFTAREEAATRKSKDEGRDVLEVLVVRDPYDIVDTDVSHARAGVDEKGRPRVEFTMTKKGGERLAALTGANLPDPAANTRRQLSIILGGRLYSAPFVQTTISRAATIEGSFTRRDVDDIVAVLNAPIFQARTTSPKQKPSAEPSPTMPAEDHENSEPRPLGSGGRAVSALGESPRSLTVAARNGAGDAARNEKTITIAGRCVDENGQPVADAEVVLCERTITEFSAEYRKLRDMKTAPDGKFRFADLPSPSRDEQSMKWLEYQVLARKPGRATAGEHLTCEHLTRLEPKPDRVVLKMRPAVSLTGRVTDPAGRPVAGALVCPFGGEGIEGFGSARTDRQGNFTINDLAAWKPEDTRVENEDGTGTMAVSQAFSVNHPDYAVGRIDVTKIPSTANATLYAGGVIEGRVLDSLTGQPAAGVVVFAQGTLENHNHPGADRVVTDSAGRYRFTRLPAGKYNLWPRAKDRTAVAIDSFEAVAGQTREAPDIKLIEGGLIEGQIIDAETGKPITQSRYGGISVAVNGPASPRSGAACQSSAVDAEGRFRHRVPPGMNYVYVQQPDIAGRIENWGDFSGGIDVQPGEVVNLTLRVLPRVTPK